MNRHLLALLICLPLCGCWVTVTGTGSVGAGKDALEVHKGMHPPKDVANQQACTSVRIRVIDPTNSDPGRSVYGWTHTPYKYATATMSEEGGTAATLFLPSAALERIIYRGKPYFSPTLAQVSPDDPCTYQWYAPQED